MTDSAMSAEIHEQYSSGWIYFLITSSKYGYPACPYTHLLMLALRMFFLCRRLFA